MDQWKKLVIHLDTDLMQQIQLTPHLPQIAEQVPVLPELPESTIEASVTSIPVVHNKGIAPHVTDTDFLCYLPIEDTVMAPDTPNVVSRIPIIGRLFSSPPNKVKNV